jgi:hypothetical protein
MFTSQGNLNLFGTPVTGVRGVILISRLNIDEARRVFSWLASEGAQFFTSQDAQKIDIVTIVMRHKTLFNEKNLERVFESLQGI